MNNPQLLPWDNPRFKNWIAVIRAERAVGRAMTKALAPLDLKIGQLDMMINVYRHPGQSQHDLARRLLVGRSSITMLLPELERMGLIDRTPDEADKRVIRLTLTPRGEERLMQALAVYTELIERVMSQTTPEHCELIGDAMRRVEELLKDPKDA